MIRETIYAALFTKLATLSAGGSPLFKTTSRKLRHWADVPAEEQPALFQVQTTETKAQQKGQPKIWTLRGDLYIYVNTSAQLDPTVVPSQLLNPLLDAVESAFGTDDVSSNVQTLGGLCSHCWIDGSIETSEGNLGDQEVAIVPFAILVPAQ